MDKFFWKYISRPISIMPSRIKELKTLSGRCIRTLKANFYAFIYPSSTYPRTNIFCAVHAFFTRATLWKAKQHGEAKLLFEILLLPSSTLLSENNSRCSKKYAKIKKYVCFNEIIWFNIMKVRQKMKNRSHRYEINRSRSRHGHKYTEYKMCLSMMMVIYIKQHQTTLQAQFMK